MDILIIRIINNVIILIIINVSIIEVKLKRCEKREGDIWDKGKCVIKNKKYKKY